jgi:hypothetical protein
MPLALPIALVVLASLAPATTGETPPKRPEAFIRTLVLQDLSTKTGRLHALDATRVSIVGPGGIVASTPTSDVLAVVMPPVPRSEDAARAAIEAWRDVSLIDEVPQGVVRLVDGQVFPGLLSSEPAGADRVRWASRVGGLLAFPLERVSALQLRPGKPPSTDGKSDVLQLTNGDRVQGFLASVGPVFTIEVDGKPTTIESSRVAAAAMANATKPAQGTWVWLASGAACRVKALTLGQDGRGELSLEAAEGPPIAVEPGEVRAVVVDASLLKTLSAAKARVKPGDADRPWMPPPVTGDSSLALLGAADIELPGPMTVTWSLPGATRIAGTVELPVSARLWGDCEVAIEAVASGRVRPLWRQRLNESTPEAAFNLELPGGSDLEWTVRLEAGDNGPIMDRVVLRRVLVK